MTGHHTRLLLWTIGGGLLNVVLSLRPRSALGRAGIALATTLTLIAFNVAMVSTAKRLVGVRTFVYRKPSEWRGALRLIGPEGEGDRG